MSPFPFASQGNACAVFCIERADDNVTARALLLSHTQSKVIHETIQNESGSTSPSFLPCRCNLPCDACRRIARGTRG